MTPVCLCVICVCVRWSTLVLAFRDERTHVVLGLGVLQRGVLLSLLDTKWRWRTASHLLSLGRIHDAVVAAGAAGAAGAGAAGAGTRHHGDVIVFFGGGRSRCCRCNRRCCFEMEFLRKSVTFAKITVLRRRLLTGF
jgi:hypothetical protein